MKSSEKPSALNKLDKTTIVELYFVFPVKLFQYIVFYSASSDTILIKLNQFSLNLIKLNQITSNLINFHQIVSNFIKSHEIESNLMKSDQI